MATEIILPHLGESIESAVFAVWHKQVGESVKRGEDLADVETDKATMPLECPRNGVLLAQFAVPGDEVRIGQLLAVVGQPGESWGSEDSGGTADSAPPPVAEAPAPPAESLAPVVQVDSPPPRPARKLRISPLARRKAKELGININDVQPGNGDKVSSKDVDRYAAEHAAAGVPAPAPAAPAPLQPPLAIPSHRVDLTNLRRIVGRRMLESAQSSPQFSVSLEAEVTRLQAFRATMAGYGSKVSYTALLIYFTARVLQQFPLANAQFDGSGLVVYDTINMAVAVATPGGLHVPVIHGVEGLALYEIDRRLSTLAEKARANRLAPDEIASGTFTLSNLGMMGISQFVPIINPPQAAILGVGAPQERFVPDAQGAPVLARQMNLTLGADHRVLDGADAAAFLAALKTEIEACQIDRIA